ncbi:hypothetical protein RZO50_03595 [Microbacterium sp. SSW1-59]|uniref:hypothetical protein n=1 Tax=Microbacterium xanthum TaxID=3079794 RepID=UPI002AD4FDE8|nr:hypothetical protein [Microbacterium sp. SSW1-59]MDZ8200581.1 hypothetical protein [Microbacterium sp. SSW1-59]
MTSFADARDRLRLLMFDAAELGIFAGTLPEADNPAIAHAGAEASVGVHIAGEGFATNARVHGWDVSFQEVLQVALARTPTTTLTGAGTIELADEGQIAALLLDPSRASDLDIVGDLTLLPLSPSRSIVLGATDEEGFGHALDVADELIRAGAPLASIHPLSFTDGVWTPLPWRERFPGLRTRIARVTREFGIRAYREQAKVLDESEVRVLDPRLEELDDGTAVTFATWLSGTAALLPVVDNVFLARPDGRLAVMGFADFVARSDGAVRRTDLVPLRFFIPDSLAFDGNS